MDRPEGYGELPPPPEPGPHGFEAPAAPPPTTRQLVNAVFAGLAAAIVAGSSGG